MPAILGSGEHRYRVVENFAKLPDGWNLTDVASVAVDSKDRIYVFNRGDHPMVVLDRDGNFVRSWGEGLFARAHGLHIDAAGARMKSGETISADLIVLATGYKRQEELVRKLFGEEVTRRVGTIWGFGEEQELRNMYVRTGQPGLWFIAGGLAQCRIGSKYLALQIKAIEEGLLPHGR